MLKVVGASWLQTRFTMYFLISVGVFGVGTFIFSEYGRVENDGIYSATVLWSEKGSYSIEFWGQGNDLPSLPRGAARAYYKPGIYETGWSILEIETNAEYPDEVQAFAAGLLEGSLTWQLIYHHWYNTIRAACAPRAALCKKIGQFLSENREKVKSLITKHRKEDPYWHMIHLFHTQLRGLEHGWKLAVQRSRQSLSLEPEDFYYLAMASDLMDVEQANNGTNNNAHKGSTILLKLLPTSDAESIIAFAKNTAAPYSKMLRLIKKYKFDYHLLPDKKSKLIPGQSVIMTTFPGALSSQDENYIIYGEEDEMVVAGIPIFVNNRSLWNQFNSQDQEQVLSPARIMAANRLTLNAKEWSEILIRHNSGTSNRQWISFNPRSKALWVAEQIPGVQYRQDYSDIFAEQGYLVCTGVPFYSDISAVSNPSKDDSIRSDRITDLQQNITTFSEIQDLIRGKFVKTHEAESNNENSTDFSIEEDIFQQQLRQIVSYRGDLDTKIRRPIGIIDSVGILMNSGSGIEVFEAWSGPPNSKDRSPFSWSKTFPNMSHVGHPDIFNFESIKPLWVWY